MDIALFTPNGELVASLSDTNSNSKTSSSVIYKALETSEYIEFDRPVDLVSYDQTPLYFIQRVMDGSSPIGVLCMSFKFVDETQRISEMLNEGDKGFELVLTNESGILYNTTSQDSSSSQFYQDKMQSFSERKINNQETFCFSCQASGYQGYKGLSWVSSCYIPVDVSFRLNEGNLIQQSLSHFSALFPADLNMLNLEINTALTIVVLNGKISSLKNQVQTFLPILDYFQDIGKEIKEVFSDSINHIHAVSHSTIQEKASFAAQISQEVIDRNLYERANDVRWWALNPLISETLSSNKINEYGKISQTLEIINDLYTVYTLLFIFDTNGKVIAVSKPDYEHLLGSNLKDNSMLKSVSGLSSTQQYTVSDFSNTGFYNEKPTYIYFGAVRDAQNSNVIGGIAAVFDSEPEFQAILEDFLPKDPIGETLEGAFSFVVDGSSKIISSTENKFGLQAGIRIDQLSNDFQKLIKTNETQISLDGVEYIIANNSSFGYREFKNCDGYENDMTCYVCLKS
ncbi:cache domain-containing protein [Thiomicrorhabdus indica]|uniref:cache domain-containing protein n=1 Tax=Thiomicrorhabdus indica TaxID=2267253 RepID=UPI002AA799BE|nr:cache domain-containing protein [Thiomicrorhabdus indica]